MPEEWGGDVQFTQVSAKTGEGIDRCWRSCCCSPKCSN